MLVLSCSSTQKKSDDEKYAYFVRGTLHFVNVEGGCWQLMSDEDEAYELSEIDLSPIEFDGVRVEAQVKDILDAVSFCMVGKIVKVLRLNKLYNE